MRTLIFVGIIALLLISCNNAAERTAAMDAFASCLDESGAQMFGAYWCPHCTQQKQLFGPSVQHINYIECSLPNRAGVTKACEMEGISSYPTWKFSDGTVQGGVMSLEQLAEQTGCVL